MKSLILLLAIALWFTGCSKGDAVPVTQTTFKGTYSGSADYGTVDIKISSTNKVTGTVTTSSSFSSNIDGEVIGGSKVSFSAGSTTTGSIFDGTISGTTISGNWKYYNNTDNGTWVVYRQ